MRPEPTTPVSLDKEPSGPREESRTPPGPPAEPPPAPPSGAPGAGRGPGWPLVAALGVLALVLVIAAGVLGLFTWSWSDVR